MKLPMILRKNPNKEGPTEEKREQLLQDPKKFPQTTMAERSRKSIEKTVSKEMMEGRLPGQDVRLEAMKRYPHAQK